MGASSIDPEVLFGQLVVQQGLAKAEHVQECLNRLKELAARNTTPLPRLSDLLIESGYLKLEGFDRTIRVADEPAPSRPAAAPADPRGPKGEAFGKYIRTEKLGEGGMGEVWKAWDTELQRWVAIKFLKGGDATEVARFRREAQTAARLDHPNITAIYEAGESHIVMQFVEGKTLAKIPRKDPRTIAEVMKQAALAVHYAHEQEVLHRDLKPVNIMVAGDGRVYVMDFGLAKSMSLDSSISVSGSVVGTPAYMSPEQAKGGAVDRRTDVYSLGATLYELMTDRPPFRGANVYEIMKKVVEEEPLPISKIDLLADRDLDTIAMKCLEKDPARRYATALELADDLGRTLAGDLILARPVSKSERLRRYVRKHRAILLPTAVAVLLGLGFAGRLVVQALQKSSKIRRGLDEATRIEREAVGPRAFRRAKLLQARAVLVGIVKLDEDNAEAKRARDRVEAALQLLLKEEDEELAQDERRLRKEQVVSEILGKWGRLRATLEKLESIFYDSTASLEEKRKRAGEFWPEFRNFLDQAESDSASRATARALGGWARRLAGFEEEGIAWVREAAALDPEIPYGVLIEALVLFSVWVHPRLPYDRAPLETLLRKLRGDQIWAAQSKDDFAVLISAMRAVLKEDLASADRELTVAIASPGLDPFDADLHFARGGIRLLRKDFSGALEDLEKERVFRPRQAELHFMIAQSESGLERIERALSAYEKALELDPRYWQAHFEQGLLWEKLSRPPLAIEAYEAALKIEPGAREVTEALRRLRSK